MRIHNLIKNIAKIIIFLNLCNSSAAFANWENKNIRTYTSENSIGEVYATDSNGYQKIAAAKGCSIEIFSGIEYGIGPRQANISVSIVNDVGLANTWIGIPTGLTIPPESPFPTSYYSGSSLSMLNIKNNVLTLMNTLALFEPGSDQQYQDKTQVTIDISPDGLVISKVTFILKHFMANNQNQTQGPPILITYAQCFGPFVMKEITT